ncbi:GTP-binding protein, partial [Staphylococcus nepalensis]
MKNIKNQKTSITVITGFLGSGKTTFLSKYIK